MDRTESRRPRVLIADDQEDVLEALRLLLKGEGFRTEAVSSPAKVLAALDRDEFDAVLIDLNYARDTTSGQEGLEIQVVDEGPGLANTANLFVPFFTTKPGGSGIGLVLCRQIAEAHGGSLTLENRKDHTGCLARLRLPLE